MAERWIHENFKVVTDREFNGDKLISWGNDLYTPVATFLSFFKDEIEQAISKKMDIRQAIANSDNGRGYKYLILN